MPRNLYYFCTKRVAPPVDKYVTLSLGVFTMIPTPEYSPELLILLTDKALYQAKAQGRDRVQSGTG